MKFKKSVLIIVILMSYKMTAQLKDSSLSALDLTAGYFQEGKSINLSYSLYKSEFFKSNYFQFAVSYSNAEMKIENFSIPYSLTAGNISYFYNIFSNNSDKINLSLGAGALFGQEKINKGNKLIDQYTSISTEGGFIYGLTGAAEADFFVIPGISFILKINQQYHINSALGKYALYGGAGFKFFF